jgi:hypothetical protein
MNVLHTQILVLVMALLQAWVGVDQAIKGNAAVAVMFLGYTVSNIAYFFIVK